MSFVKCKQIKKHKLKPRKDSSNKSVNNYSLFSSSSSLISSLESSSRISLESALSKNSWRQLHRSEQRISFELHLHDPVAQLLDLHSHTVRSRAGTMSPSVAIAIGPSSEDFQPYYCGSTWLMRIFVVSCQIHACTTERN